MTGSAQVWSSHAPLLTLPTGHIKQARQWQRGAVVSLNWFDGFFLTSPQQVLVLANRYPSLSTLCACVRACVRDSSTPSARWTATLLAPRQAKQYRWYGVVQTGPHLGHRVRHTVCSECCYRALVRIVHPIILGAWQPLLWKMASRSDILPAQVRTHNPATPYS